MGTETAAAGFDRFDAGKWLTGAVAGAVGAVLAALVLFAFGAFEPSEATIEVLGILFMPGAVFGLLYAGITSLDQLARLAAEPRTGAVLGLVYGILFWSTTIIGDAFSLGGLVAGLTFGVVIGLLYSVSPYVE